MEKRKIGEIVSRKSYNCDILFRIVNIKEINDEFVYVLKGISNRLQADACEADLVSINLHNKKDSKFEDIHIM